MSREEDREEKREGRGKKIRQRGQESWKKR